MTLVIQKYSLVLVSPKDLMAVTVPQAALKLTSILKLVLAQPSQHARSVILVFEQFPLIKLSRGLHNSSAGKTLSVKVATQTLASL